MGFDPEYSDFLRDHLVKWLKEANSSQGSLPDGVTPTDWAVRHFLDAWRTPVRTGVDSIEADLNRALDALKRGKSQTAAAEISNALQTLHDFVADELGLYDWNSDTP